MKLFSSEQQFEAMNKDIVEAVLEPAKKEHHVSSVKLNSSLLTKLKFLFENEFNKSKENDNKNAIKHVLQIDNLHASENHEKVQVFDSFEIAVEPDAPKDDLEDSQYDLSDDLYKSSNSLEIYTTFDHDHLIGGHECVEFLFDLGIQNKVVPNINDENRLEEYFNFDFGTDFIFGCISPARQDDFYQVQETEQAAQQYLPAMQAAKHRSGAVIQLKEALRTSEQSKVTYSIV